VNSVTGANWEGKGVEPDEKVAAADAFNIAYNEELKGIESATKDPQAKSEVPWAEFALDAQIKPVRLSDDALVQLAGNYGTRHVTAEQGQLYLQLGDGPRRKLSPLTADTFSGRRRSAATEICCQRIGKVCEADRTFSRTAGVTS
jgi:hypothetical protein